MKIVFLKSNLLKVFTNINFLQVTSKHFTLKTIDLIKILRAETSNDNIIIFRQPIKPYKKGTRRNPK
jgi:hypothetical protein